MAETRQVTPRPELRPQARPVVTQVQARVNDYLGALPQGDAEMAGLIKGLAAFNPALENYGMAEGRAQMAHQRQQAVDSAQAEAQKVATPRDALTGDPVPVPETVGPAFSEDYRRAFGNAVAQRAALENKSEMLQAYAEQKDTEGFNVDSFLAERRQQVLAGVRDPNTVAILGAHLQEAEQVIRTRAMEDAVRKHEEQRLTTASRLTEGFAGNMDASSLADRFFNWYVPQMASIQVDQKQAAGLLLNRVKQLSDEGGGRPDLFEVFKQKDAEGFTILDRNPGLGDHIIQAQDHAKRQRQQALKQAQEPMVAQLLMGYDDDIRNTPERVTTERLVADVKADHISPEKAASLWHEANVARQKKAQEGQLLADADRGMLGFYDPKDQGKVLDQMLNPTARSMWEAALSGNRQQAQALADILMQRHSKTGATVPVDTLARMLETTVTNLPNPNGPDAKFLASAEVYRALGSNPQYRAKYFKDAQDELMGAFVRHREAGMDDKSAYEAAYKSIDPATKEAARKALEQPQMQDKLRSMAVKYATGSSMWGWLPWGNGRPDNASVLGAWAASQVRSLVEQRPELADNPSALEEFIKQKAADNWVLDTTNQVAVKVPPSLSQQYGAGLVQEAVSAYTKAQLADLKAKKELPEDGTVVLRPDPSDNGLMTVQVIGKGLPANKGAINLTDIVNWHRAKSTLSQEEGAALAGVRQALKAGKELPQVDPALLAKGRSVGFLGAFELGEMERKYREQVLQRLNQVPDFGFGKPTNDASPVPLKPFVSIDPKTTTRIAQELATAPVTGRGWEHMGLAGSLIAMREGVALTAYTDPNPAAGRNIGAGYNLKANAEYVDRDLKGAGVPAERIEDVKAGRASLTPEQAKRLIQIALPRYEEQTRKVAEATAPGLWARMLPSQRAVMVDIAYQVGDPGQFKKAWSALAAGNTAEFAKETAVFYTDKAGQRVEDRRARELRASMLAGFSDWSSRVQLASK